MTPSLAGAPRPAQGTARPNDALSLAADLPPEDPADPPADPALLARCHAELLDALPPPGPDAESEARLAAESAAQLAGLAPRDAQEGMMAVQMVALHRAALQAIHQALAPEPEPALAPEPEPDPQTRPRSPGAAAAARDLGLKRAGQMIGLFGRLAEQLDQRRHGQHKQITILHLRRGPDRRDPAAAEAAAEFAAEREAQRQSVLEAVDLISRRVSAYSPAREPAATAPEAADGCDADPGSRP